MKTTTFSDEPSKNKKWKKEKKKKQEIYEKYEQEGKIKYLQSKNLLFWTKFYGNESAVWEYGAKLLFRFVHR